MSLAKRIRSEVRSLSDNRLRALALRCLGWRVISLPALIVFAPAFAVFVVGLGFEALGKSIQHIGEKISSFLGAPGRFITSKIRAEYALARSIKKEPKA